MKFRSFSDATNLEIYSYMLILTLFWLENLSYFTKQKPSTKREAQTCEALSKGNHSLLRAPAVWSGWITSHSLSYQGALLHMHSLAYKKKKIMIHVLILRKEQILHWWLRLKDQIKGEGMWTGVTNWSL